MISSWLRTVASMVAAAIVMWATSSVAFAQLASGAPAPTLVYVISDLHFSVGRVGADYHPMEDFRWPRALEGFLQRISVESPTGVMLVIAGDFLELWQHPKAKCTRLKDTECGCNMDEMTQILTDVLDGHKAELIAIGDFLASPGNSVVVLPGNHDAALTDDDIWEKVVQRIPPERRGRFTRIVEGVLLTPDGRIAVEHGHQQTFDANYFPDWPRGATKQCGTEQRFFRTWGENFVQTLYNDVELALPLIDNLVPDSEGAALYKRYSAEQGTKWADIARFIEFNLLQTSFYQKGQILELKKPSEQLTREDVQRCRLCLSEEIFVIENPLAEEILQRGGDDAASLRSALKDRERNLGDDQAKTLCERAVLLSGGKLSLKRGKTPSQTCEDPLATGLRAIFDADGGRALRSRVAELYERSQKRLALYIFGHTHEARLGMAVEMPDGLTIDAWNTGAFQRLMNRAFLESKRQSNEKDLDTLRRLKHTDLSACYTVVRISYKGRRPDAELKQWFMNETDAQGRFLDDCDPTCSAPPANCGKKKPK
jgi:UDP-2,3-diacylglucosamine pyrophosphatase LpxH